jgi:hypothetical protein
MINSRTNESGNSNEFERKVISVKHNLTNVKKLLTFSHFQGNFSSFAGLFILLIFIFQH